MKKLQPSLRFLAITLLISLTAGNILAEPPGSGMKTLLTFDSPANAGDWPAVNDGVMGGLSRGGAAIENGYLIFSGTLSLENNGGFSSVRHLGDWDLSDSDGLVLRVKGDGRTYKVRLSTDARYQNDRVAYSASFPAKKGEWTEVRVPFSEFTPSHHGRQLDGPPLDPSKIEQIGLLIGDKKAGSFQIAVDWIAAD